MPRDHAPAGRHCHGSGQSVVRPRLLSEHSALGEAGQRSFLHRHPGLGYRCLGHFVTFLAVQHSFGSVFGLEGPGCICCVKIVSTYGTRILNKLINKGVPFSDHNLLIPLIKLARQPPLLAGIARLRAGALDFLPATSGTTG